MQLCQGKPLPPRQRVSPGDGDAVAILPQREKIAAVQPLTGVAGTDKEVKFLSQGADLSQNPLVVVLIGDEVELVAGEVPAEAVPQVPRLVRSSSFSSRCRSRALSCFITAVDER